MSSDGVHHDEMNEHTDISERDAERLLAGDRAPDLRGLGDVASFLDAMGDAFPEETQPARASEHLSAMMAAAASTDPGLSNVRRLLVSRRARFAALVLAATLAFAGAAFAGVLPAGVQRAVSRAAGAIGVSLPSPKTPDAAERPAAPKTGPSDDPAAPADTVEPTGAQDTQGAQGASEEGADESDGSSSSPSSATDEQSSGSESPAEPAEGGAQSPAPAD